MPVCFNSLEKRDEIYSELILSGIKSRKYFYPLTVFSDYFKEKGKNLVEEYNLHVAADISNRVLCLPLYADLDIGVVDKIVKIIGRLT
jgi:dTDP-4-amino-4,6-dideoxygalactose transaminase